MSENSQNKKLTKLTIAALCSKAARSGPNEDNCLVITDLGSSTHSIDVSGPQVDLVPTCVNLENYGCLLVVADGMGGMNAGEVASAIAVQTIREYFIERLANIGSTESDFQNLMSEAIKIADEAIVNESARDESKFGMGTTVALLWIFDNKAYYAWCGDSRVYLYRENNELGEGRGDKSLNLQSLTLDHSYVMTPANKSPFGKEGGLGLTEDEAFEHPMNNVIMRSLGNPSERANPDVRGPIRINQDDIFLLCSDGLCGAMRTKTIQDCIESAKEGGIGNVLNKIWSATPDIEWHDNMTTLLCHVTYVPKMKATVAPTQSKQPSEQTSAKYTTEKEIEPTSPISDEKPKIEKDRSPFTKQLIMAAIATVVVLSVLFGILSNRAKKSSEKLLNNSEEVSAKPSDETVRAGVDTTFTTQQKQLEKKDTIVIDSSKIVSMSVSVSKGTPSSNTGGKSTQATERSQPKDESEVKQQIEEKTNKTKTLLETVKKR